MKATELRIGNLVSDGVYGYKISVLEKGHIQGLSNTYEKQEYPDVPYPGAPYHLFEADITGIPLTEEWLLKFGFDFYEGEMIGETSMNDNWTLGLFKINVWGNGWLFYWDDKWDNRIKYVHQLQNLYFFLTGEELTLKS